MEEEEEEEEEEVLVSNGTSRARPLVFLLSKVQLVWVQGL